MSKLRFLNQKLGKQRSQQLELMRRRLEATRRVAAPAKPRKVK